MDEQMLKKEFEGISAALKNVGFTDATIAYRQKFWREFYIFHGDLEITEQSLNDFLERAYEIDPHNVNITKRQYDVRASLRNLLEYKTFGRIINCHTAWYMDMPWPEKFRPVVDEFLEQQREKGNKPETVIQYARTLKRFAAYASKVGIDSVSELKPEHISGFLLVLEEQDPYILLAELDIVGPAFDRIRTDIVAEVVTELGSFGHIELECHLIALAVEVVDKAELLNGIKVFKGASQRRKAHLKVSTGPGEVSPCIFYASFIDGHEVHHQLETVIDKVLS